MFTKNIKTISILALVAVIVLVASVLIAIGNDSNVTDGLNGKLEDTEKSYEQKIAELNKIIDDLKAGLTDTETALKKLEENGIKLDQWGLATEAVAEKLEKLDETYNKFIESFEKWDEKLEIFVTDAHDYFDDETIDGFYESYMNAYIAILRATSVDAMDKVIADFDAELKATKTVIDVLEDMLTELEKDAITGDDLQGILDAKAYFEDINDVLFGEGEKAAFEKRINDLLTACDKAIVDAFIASVNALPTTTELTLSDEHVNAVEKVEAVLEYIVNNELVQEENEEFETAVEKFYNVAARLNVLTQIANDAETVNALIKAEADTTFGADINSANTIKTLNAAVANWEKTYSVITDSEAEGYNEWIHNLVDYDSLAGYVKAFETATADLRAAATEFINAVNSFGKINTESKEALDAIIAKYTATVGTTGPETVDAILGITKAEESVVSAWNKYLALRASYTYLVNSIETVENFVREIYTLVPGSTDKYELHADLKTEEDYWNIDLLIANILGTYELDETVFDATLIAQYKIARLDYIIKDAKANVDAAYAASTNEHKDEAKAALYLMIESAAGLDYKLVAIDVSFDVDNNGARVGKLDHKFEIDDSKNASVVESLEIFTIEYCTEFFAQFHA